MPVSNQLKQLGVIGGMGPEATAVFYARLIARTDARRDQEHIQTVILSDAGMPDRTAALLAGRGDEIYARLLRDAALLIGCGCSVLAIPCNTTHHFADRLQAEVSAQVLHMPRETVARLDCKRVGILATDGALRAEVYQSACIARGIEPILPAPEVQKLVMRLIYDDIKAGKPGDDATFAAIDAHLRTRGCEAVILACTELSVYAGRRRLPNDYLDAMEVLVESAVTACGKPLREHKGTVLPATQGDGSSVFSEKHGRTVPLCCGKPLWSKEENE